MNGFKPGCYYGHSANDDGRGVPELLRDHLQRVAAYAAQFAAAFGAEDQAKAAALLHDLGKYAAYPFGGIDGVLDRVMFIRILALLPSTY